MVQEFETPTSLVPVYQGSFQKLVKLHHNYNDDSNKTAYIENRTSNQQQKNQTTQEQLAMIYQ
jgi:hypothetical protein